MDNILKTLKILLNENSDLKEVDKINKELAQEFKRYLSWTESAAKPFDFLEVKSEKHPNKTNNKIEDYHIEVLLKLGQGKKVFIMKVFVTVDEDTVKTNPKKKIYVTLNSLLPVQPYNAARGKTSIPLTRKIEKIYKKGTLSQDELRNVLYEIIDLFVDEYKYRRN